MNLYRTFAESKDTGNVYEVIVLADDELDVYGVIDNDTNEAYTPFGDVTPVTVNRPRVIAWQKQEG